MCPHSPCLDGWVGPVLGRMLLVRDLKVALQAGPMGERLAQVLLLFTVPAEDAGHPIARGT